MKQLVSLGGFVGNFYTSANPNVAPGIGAGFNAFCAIRGGSSEVTDPILYFGNSDLATTGWSFRRLADVAEDPLTGAPAFAVLAFVLAEAVELSAIVHIPKPLFVGRTFFLGGAFRGDGNDFSFYVNGSRSAAPVAFAGAYAPGASSLQFGNTDGFANADRLIGGAFTNTTFGNIQVVLDSVHNLAFQNFVHTQASAAMFDAISETFAFAAVTPAEYVYDAWDVRGPSLTTVSPLPNEGTAAGGDLAWGVANVLNVEVDRVPNFTGSTNIPIVIP